MTRRRYLWWALGGVFTLGVNLVLFVLPLLVAAPEMPEPLPEMMGAVRLSSLPEHEQRDSQEKISPEDEITPQEFTETMPQPEMDTPDMPQPQLDIDIPLAELDINPNLVDGMAVPAPSQPAVAAAPAPSSAGGALTIGELDDTPRVLFKVQPPYPFQAERRGVTGHVLAKMFVDEKGHVTKVKILGGKNVEVFAETVRKTLLRWRFKPGTKNGRPVRWHVNQKLTFSR